MRMSGVRSVEKVAAYLSEDGQAHAISTAPVTPYAIQEPTSTAVDPVRERGAMDLTTSCFGVVGVAFAPFFSHTLRKWEVYSKLIVSPTRGNCVRLVDFV